MFPNQPPTPFQEAQNDLLNAIREPVKKKKVNNSGLWIALAFFNLVLLVIEIGSASTVYWVTHIWFYAALIFLAGAVPLGLAEFLYVRPFSSLRQRSISVAMALIAVASILGMGVCAAIINSNLIEHMSISLTTPVTVIVVIVALIHGILCGWYFYSDEGIVADQVEARAIATAMRRRRQLAAADEILKVTDGTVQRRRDLAGQYGNKAALDEVLRQLGLEDADHNGIPDRLEKHGRFAPGAANTFASTASRQDFGQTDNHDKPEPGSVQPPLPLK